MKLIALFLILTSFSIHAQVDLKKDIVLSQIKSDSFLFLSDSCRSSQNGKLSMKFVRNEDDYYFILALGSLSVRYSVSSSFSTVNTSVYSCYNVKRTSDKVQTEVKVYLRENSFFVSDGFNSITNKFEFGDEVPCNLKAEIVQFFK